MIGLGNFDRRLSNWSPYLIRPCQSRDVEAIREIDLHAYGERWSRRDFAKVQVDQRFRHLVALANSDRGGALASGGVVAGHGVVRVGDDVAHLLNLAVSVGFRGQGLGSRLLVELLAQLPAGVRRAELEVRASNRRAQQLYIKFGFAPVGIERGFYPAADLSPGDALVMQVADTTDLLWLARLERIRAEFCRPPTAQQIPGLSPARNPV